ncbi:MAG: FtsL-like putative cell division protein [Prevotella sp.]
MTDEKKNQPTTADTTNTERDDAEQNTAAKQKDDSQVTAPGDEKQRETDAKESDSDALSLKRVIAEQVTEGESPFSRNFTLRKILGGDMLNTTFVRRQIGVVLLITFFAIVYISSRYACQQKIIEIDKLQRELKDAKYKALSSRSQITEKSRESNVLDMLKNNKDSVLKIASQPPYIIQVPESESNN